MIRREMGDVLQVMATQYPIVTLLGPRQSGKTTLVRECFQTKPYANVEEIDTRELATQDPRGFLQQYPDGAIIDEIQRAPALLSYLQAQVDQDKRKGLFILTGSHQLQLKQEISQSLAGRTALLYLLPLTLSELNTMQPPRDLNTQLISGCYPGVLVNQMEPYIAYRNYFQTYIERDLAQIIHVKDSANFQRFMKLVAGRIGQLLNKNSLSGELGISSTTVEHWLSVLEASHITVRLSPYFENFGKRIVESQKIYFTDTGLASYLLGIQNNKQMDRDPMRPYLFENLVFLELMKRRYNQGYDHQLYFYRDHNQLEVDFVFQAGHELVPIEVKSSKTVQMEFLKGLNRFMQLAKDRCPKGFLIYAGPTTQSVGACCIINYAQTQSCVMQPQC